MYFEESYFEGEEREGFYIEPMMKRAWAAQLEVLQVIDEICVRNNIEYFADWGTLLGAIRHGGYIPWDDDLDIGMKRLDYERFFKIAEKELPQGYSILRAADDEDWRGIFGRVVNSTDICWNHERMEQFHGFPYTAGIDIFPLDYLPVDESEKEMMLDMFRATYQLAYEWDGGEFSEEEKMEYVTEIERSCNVTFTKDKPYPQQLWILAGRIASMYWDMADSAKELAQISRYANDPGFAVPVSCYETAQRVPFENTTIPIPVGYEQILTAYYGEDYMTPKQGAAGHDYVFYRRQQEIALTYLKERGLEVPEWMQE